MLKLRILIVDDDDDIRQQLIALLGEKYQIVGAVTYGELLRITDDALPDLIVVGSRGASVRPEDKNIILVARETIHKAEEIILSCEGCDEDAQTPFSEVLDWLIGAHFSVTDYLLEQPGSCPRCLDEITETTFIRPAR